MGLGARPAQTHGSRLLRLDSGLAGRLRLPLPQPCA